MMRLLIITFVFCLFLISSCASPEAEDQKHTPEEMIDDSQQEMAEETMSETSTAMEQQESEMTEQESTATDEHEESSMEASEDHTDMQDQQSEQPAATQNQSTPSATVTSTQEGNASQETLQEGVIKKGQMQGFQRAAHGTAEIVIENNKKMLLLKEVTIDAQGNNELRVLLSGYNKPKKASEVESLPYVDLGVYAQGKEVYDIPDNTDLNKVLTVVVIYIDTFSRIYASAPLGAP